MIKEIKKLCQSDELVEIYDTNADDTFYVCNIITCNDDHLLLRCFGRNGNYCGYKIIRTDSVIAIAHDTIYLNDQKKIISGDAVEYGFPKGYWNDIDLIDVFFNFCKKNNLLAGIELDDGKSWNGYINSIDTDEEIIKLKVYNLAGNYDGIYVVRLGDIKIAEIDGTDQVNTLQFINAK